MMLKLMLAAISIYKSISVLRIYPSCRFLPSCSEYSREALLKHGAWKGLLLTMKRVARCHPFCEGGFDPVR